VSTTINALSTTITTRKWKIQFSNITRTNAKVKTKRNREKKQHKDTNTLFSVYYYLRASGCRCISKVQIDKSLAGTVLSLVRGPRFLDVSKSIKETLIIERGYQQFGQPVIGLRLCLFLCLFVFVFAF